jgi:hypothetical protein
MMHNELTISKMFIDKARKTENGHIVANFTVLIAFGANVEKNTTDTRLFIKNLSLFRNNAGDFTTLMPRRSYTDNAGERAFMEDIIMTREVRDYITEKAVAMLKSELKKPKPSQEPAPATKPDLPFSDEILKEHLNKL